MTLEQWIAEGEINGFIVGEWCIAHDVPPITEEEGALDPEDVLDMCMRGIRVKEPT